MPVSERIIARAAGRAAVRPGDEVWTTVDRAVMNDSSGPRRMAALVERLGGKVWDPEKVVLVSDHFIPAATIRHAEILSVTRNWAKEKGLVNFFEYDGILHNLLLERRLVEPGQLLVGADSHTVTAGASGAVAIPIGSNELGAVLVTGEVWLRVPETICLRLEGVLQPGVMARDIDFQILGRLKNDFATYRSVEFAGSALDGLSIDERSVLSNAGIEMGAKNAIVPADAVTAAWYQALDDQPDWAAIAHDPAADFAQTHVFDVSGLEPQVALPHRVDNVAGISDVEPAPITGAHIGSCVGAKLTDLRAAAMVLRGQKVSVPLVVTPATRAAMDAAVEDGTAQTLLDAGAIIQAPGCGPCAGVHMGVLGDGERIIASVTRNFRGRMGSREAEIYLGSPQTVAASAIAGRIADPRRYC
jgi:3-isopropylmalate/(R)-2-methylmalate dehydratase large subunit